MSDFLKNQFLVAMPGMEDERFANTVSPLCEHNDHGAIGLVINLNFKYGYSLAPHVQEAGLHEVGQDHVAVASPCLSLGVTEYRPHRRRHSWPRL